MFARKISRVGLLVCLVVPSFAIGCGREPENPAIRAGDMPAGGEWTGVYYSPTYGSLHLIEEGDTIKGRWRTTGGEAWGELTGKPDGNLLRYEWVEHKIGMVGPSSTSKGHGYFKYVKPDTADPDKIEGEWGLNDAESGSPWSATKQNNVQPNLDSVMPDEVEGHFSGGDWEDADSDKATESSGDGGDEDEDEGKDEGENEDEDEDEDME